MPAPKLGTLPENCLTGKISLGESCAVICPPGTKSNGEPLAQCLPSGQWSTINLNCVPIKARGRISQGEFHSQGRINANDPSQRKTIQTVHNEYDQRKPVQPPPSPDQNPAVVAPHRIPTAIVRPYIKCPRDTTIVLPKNQKTIYVRLEQPKSNVDWVRYVDAQPQWAKNLQAHLGAGVHTITFRARSPSVPSISEACVTVITVKSAAEAATQQIIYAPKISYCPQTIEVQLQQHEQQRPIFWREPVFTSKQPLKQIYKSNLSGTKFGVGHHRITYIATDVRNQNGTCQFSVIVRQPGSHSKCFNSNSFIM